MILPKRAETIGDRAWHDVLDRHNALVRREISRHRGHEVRTMGDGFLATFDGPARSIRCALAINEGVEALGLQMRAGLHTGEVEMADDDLSGSRSTLHRVSRRWQSPGRFWCRIQSVILSQDQTSGFMTKVVVP